MKRPFYRTGQFARRASVTIRTLRYYDRMGLLSPSQHTETGHRLYTEQDLFRLQHILALKFLGFSLEEIKCNLRRGPQQLGAVLAQQRQMMQEKRKQLDAIIQALAHTESLVHAGECEWEALIRVIQVIQMEQKTEWVKKYLNEDQLEKMKALSADAYSEEAAQKLRDRQWTEEDQKRVSAQWAYVAEESQRLAAAGADPAGEEAQALAKLKSDLLFAFTQGDPDIEAGLAKFWQNHNALPADQRPLAGVVPVAVTPGSGDAGQAFLEKAMTIYQEKETQR
ncbi:MAG TPA: MerR family transcriptional regulator [Chthonomonadaceae bacterium]|nr:MerR family transcriptional regulator [Chthonomonadaceae bacterium]